MNSKKENFSQDKTLLKKLNQWNDTALDLPSKRLLHQLFDEQVKKEPTATAVVSDNVRLSYGELFKLSNKMGNKLKKWGTIPETLVAVVMEKGWEEIVAVLGILKSGAAFLPISANDPRLNKILELGKVKYVLTQSKYLEKIDQFKYKVLDVTKR